MKRRAIIFSGEIIWKEWPNQGDSVSKGPRCAVYFGDQRVLLTDRQFEILFLLSLRRWDRIDEKYMSAEELRMDRWHPMALYHLRRAVKAQAPRMLDGWIENKEKVGYRLAQFCEPKFEPQLLLKTLPAHLKKILKEKLKTERVVIPKE